MEKAQDSWDSFIQGTAYVSLFDGNGSNKDGVVFVVG